MALTLDPIEKTVRDALLTVDSRWRRIGESDAAWTLAIKRALRAAGRSQGFVVCAGGSTTDSEGEWLYDITWLKLRRGVIVDFPLALESEWIPDDELMVDFQKLVVSRARHRVMVFWEGSAAAAKSQVARFVRQVRRYGGTRRGDRYLFAYWVRKSERIAFTQHVVV